MTYFCQYLTAKVLWRISISNFTKQIAIFACVLRPTLNVFFKKYEHTKREKHLDRCIPGLTWIFLQSHALKSKTRKYHKKGHGL